MLDSLWKNLFSWQRDLKKVHKKSPRRENSNFLSMDIEAHLKNSISNLMRKDKY